MELVQVEEVVNKFLEFAYKNGWRVQQRGVVAYNTEECKVLIDAFMIEAGMERWETEEDIYSDVPF